MEINTSFKAGENHCGSDLIALGNSEIFAKPPGSFSNVNNRSSIKTSPKSRLKSAEINFNNYLQFRSALIFLNSLTFVLTALNFELQYPSFEESGAPATAGLCLGICMHICSFGIYCCLIYAFSQTLFHLRLSRNNLNKLRFFQQALMGGVFFLVCPLPGIAAKGMFFWNRFVAPNGQTFVFRVPAGLMLFQADITISMASLVYFLIETRQDLTIQKIISRYRKGINVGFIQGIKEFARIFTLWDLLVILMLISLYLGAVVRISEGSFVIWQRLSGDYSVLFQTNLGQNNVGYLSTYRNSIWAGATTAFGASTFDAIFRCSSTIAILAAWVSIGSFFMSILPLLWGANSFQNIKKNLSAEVKEMQTARKLAQQSAADFIKVFFFRFFVYRTSGNPERLRNVENQLKTASLRLRRARHELIDIEKNTKTESVLLETTALRQNLLLIDQLLEAFNRKRAEKPQRDH